VPGRSNCRPGSVFFIRSCKIQTPALALLFEHFKPARIITGLKIRKEIRKMSFRKLLMFSVAVMLASQAAAQSVTYRWGVNVNNQTFRRGAGGWEYLPGPAMTQVSIGADGTVWGLENTLNNVRRWNGSGWEVIPGQLKQISVGSAQNIWGVNNANQIFRRVGDGWQRMPGALTQVSAAADGTVWGVTDAGNIYQWTGSAWQHVPGQLKHISVGSAQHVWGVNFSDIIFRRNGSAWESLGGYLKQVSVNADGDMWGVNAADQIFHRVGSGWDRIGGLLVNISVGPTVTGPHAFVGTQIWMDTVPTVQASTSAPVAGCPAGSQPPTKADLDTLLQNARSSGNAASFLTSASGFEASPGDAIVSSTKVYPNATNGTENNSWKFWALIVNQASVSELDTYFPAPSRMVSRCIRAIPTTPIQSDISGCSIMPGSTVDARSVNVSSIQITDLQRAPGGLPSAGRPIQTQITPHPDGGGYLLWTARGRAILTRIDATGTAADPNTDEDLGPAISTGALATNGQTIGYLLKSGTHKLEFRVKGGATTVIMDNDGDIIGRVLFSGRGLRFNDPQGNPVYGTEAMYHPLIYHRGSVLVGGGRWFTSFDHSNNFNAYTNPGTPNPNGGASMISFSGDGSQAGLVYGWGTSKSVDMRAIFDGERFISVHLGNQDPSDLEMRVTDAQSGSAGSRHYLFGKSGFADTLIGSRDGNPIYGIAGNGDGSTAGALGDLVQTGCGLYALTYTIKPATFQPPQSPVLTSTPDELGFLVLDKDGNIVTRAKLKSGLDVETVKSVRWGKSAILVAWKTQGVNEYWMMLVDARGNILQDAQKLPLGVVFSSSDTFTMVKNGDVMWTNADGGYLKLLRLPAP
jgi:virginiamycin B lyase